MKSSLMLPKLMSKRVFESLKREITETFVLLEVFNDE